MLLLLRSLLDTSGVVEPPVVEKPDVELLGGGGPVRRNLDKSSYLYRLLSPPSISKVEELPVVVVEAIEQVAKAEPKAIEPQRDLLQELGEAYRQAYKQIYLELLAEVKQAREDEQIAAAMVALL